MGGFDPVDWALAERIGRRVASRPSRQPTPPPDRDLPAQFRDLVAQAEVLVSAETRLQPLAGPAEAVVLTRADWVSVNVGSFRRLLGPLLEQWTDGSKAGGIARQVTRSSSAVELGALLGWMSSRVLGQYDMLTGGDDGAGDTVYVVGPNLQAVERRFGFDGGQFRLWVAIHECTHRAQFTGVPWLRGHFLAQLHDMTASMSQSPAELFGALRAALGDRATARQRLRDGGAVAVFAGPQAQAALMRMSGMMSLLEGHGDVVMNRAGACHIADAERFARVLSARRATANPLARLVQRLTGLEAKLNQYAAGERFLAAIESDCGPRAVDRCWTAPEALPSMDEIRTPTLWIKRLGVPRLSTRAAAV
jgi:coenzyme F420 biosynthesis associated uncharacterized protein